MVIPSIETHSITMKNLALFRPKLRNSSKYQSDCEICELLLLRCKCARIFDWIEELKSHPRDGTGIRSRNSIIIPLMIEEHRATFFTVHYESLLSKVYCRDTRDSSSLVYVIPCKQEIYIMVNYTHKTLSCIAESNARSCS